MIKVFCLGKFSVLDDATNQELTDDVLRSDMLKKLFVYMVLHRGHPVSVQELSDALWVEDETDNPQGALKNLMYRMRNALKKTFGDTQFFKTNIGSYSFNDEIDVYVDAEDFEASCKTDLEKAVSLYQGEFFEGKGDRSWIVTSATYYHSLYLSAVKGLASEYMEKEMYKEAESLLNTGLRFDNVDETLHCELIRALIKQDNFEMANAAFNNAKKILLSALGVRDSKNLRMVHEEILKMSKGVSAEKLAEIHDDMVEEEEPEGAFFCGYPAFKEIYRLESRKAERLGEAEYLLLLTAELGYAEENEKTAQFMINRFMKYLGEAIRSSLRIGDVVAKYSDSQYIVLLPTCTYESTVMVSERILKNFKEMCNNDSINIVVDMEELNGTKSDLVV